MNLSSEEIAVLQRILEKATDERERSNDFETIRNARTYNQNPVTAMLNTHTPVAINSSSWACSCNNRGIYVSKTHVIATHITPIVEKAATLKIREILERAGMDLDVIIQSDKIFGA